MSCQRYIVAIAFGIILFLIATVHHTLEVLSVGLLWPPVIAWVMDGGLALGVIYLWWRLKTLELPDVGYRTVFRWMVTGALAGAILIGMTFYIRLTEGRPLAEPIFPLLVGTNGGALLGTIAGYYAAQSKATAQKFEAIFNNTYQFTGLLRPDGTILEANDTALSFGGLDRDNVIGRKLWDAYWVEGLEESQQVVKTGVANAQDGELVTDQIRIRGDTGSAMIDFSIRPLYDDAGEIAQLIVEGRDITRIQRQKEHLSVLHRYLRHNLRNNLNTIQGYAGLLLDKLDKQPYVNRVDTIYRTASEMSNSSELVKEFSELSTEDKGEPRPQKLSEVAATAHDRAAVPMDCFTIDVESQVSILVDDRIHFAFEEFLNALGDYLDDTGKISITAKQLADQVEVEVRCLGFTVPSSELSAFDQVEERSSTHHPQGIRFWLLKSVLRECGGSVNYDTEPDDKTTILLTFQQKSQDSQPRAPRRTDS